MPTSCHTSGRTTVTRTIIPRLIILRLPKVFIRRKYKIVRIQKSCVLDKVLVLAHHGGFERDLGSGLSRWKNRMVASSNEKANTLSTELQQAREEIASLKQNDEDRDEELCLMK
ncbi:hypothetical protein H6P81_016368 [Aristolochia fimbriata]|uniref:Uncharacterized protein n=1 Tax=Aristolochia fimbriata TaxID=158543 RepID=A0AAV7E881_ARIFI|nr:hypothetical protein H6P81_016368 [Aristolochia fimbriata]